MALGPGSWSAFGGELKNFAELWHCRLRIIYAVCGILSEKGCNVRIEARSHDVRLSITCQHTSLA